MNLVNHVVFLKMKIQMRCTTAEEMVLVPWFGLGQDGCQQVQVMWKKNLHRIPVEFCDAMWTWSGKLKYLEVEDILDVEQSVFPVGCLD